ncbi:MAG: hypothetical protein QM755_16690 [Luteolibacter sp.]
MHYKNGREVKVGDRVVGILNGLPKAGIVIDTLPGSTACNIAIVPCPEYVSCSYQSKEFLHADDVAGKQTPSDEDIRAAAGRSYTAYCEAVGGVAFNGDPLPTWEEFSADTSKVKQAAGWIEAARAALAS